MLCVEGAARRAHYGPPFAARLCQFQRLPPPTLRRPAAKVLEGVRPLCAPPQPQQRQGGGLDGGGPSPPAGGASSAPGTPSGSGALPAAYILALPAVDPLTVLGPALNALACNLSPADLNDPPQGGGPAPQGAGRGGGGGGAAELRAYARRAVAQVMACVLELPGGGGSHDGAVRTVGGRDGEGGEG